MAAALSQMVIAYALNAPKLAEHHPALQAEHAAAARFRLLFTQLGEEDAAAYAVLNAAFKLSKDDPTRRPRIEAAAIDATAPPQAVLAAAADLLERVRQLPPRTSRSLHSDLAVAAALAQSAASAAAWNIHANLPLLPKEQSQDAGASGEALVDPHSIRPSGITQASVIEQTKALLDRVAVLRTDIDRQCGATP